MKTAPAALLFAASAALFAQPQPVFRGEIKGSPGERGKCTIDIVVDGIVEVEVSGTDGRARVLSGNRPQWRRLQCNMPLPPNPAEFRFRGQDGRGRQTLLREPGQNRGVAVVRIEDADGGAEGYKFDLEWRGTTPVSSGGPFDGGRPGRGGVIDSDGPGLAGWNDQLDYRGKGDGYFRDFRGSDDVLRDAAIRVDRRGRVEVSIMTARRDRIVLNGMLMQASRNKLTATITDGSIQGPIEILLDGKDRVRELAMTGTGRNRFELRWQAR